MVSRIYNKVGTWKVVDKNTKEVLEKFRLKQTALNYIAELKHLWIDAELVFDRKFYGEKNSFYNGGKNITSNADSVTTLKFTEHLNTPLTIV